MPSRTTCKFHYFFSNDLAFDRLTQKRRANEREKQSLMREKERLSMAMRSLEKDIQEQRLQEFRLESDIKEKNLLEQRKESMRTQNKTDTTRLKVCFLDTATAFGKSLLTTHIPLGPRSKHPKCSSTHGTTPSRFC
jgi:hypothetical protein